jgi:hypothetical protein
MGFGNDAKKIYSNTGKDRGGDCCGCFVACPSDVRRDSKCAEEICAGSSH